MTCCILRAGSSTAPAIAEPSQSRTERSTSAMTSSGKSSNRVLAETCASFQLAPSREDVADSGITLVSAHRHQEADHMFAGTAQVFAHGGFRAIGVPVCDRLCNEIVFG